ncbi:MAG: hypothetical protein K0R18_327 [Bacillales bacterium]|jgi:hypothetical protein|nr:hypothetical protein [Bacillales bacterium]
MEPFKMKSIMVKSSPDVRSGEQLAIEAKLRIEEAFKNDGGLDAIVAEYISLNTPIKDIYTVTAQIRVTIWGSQDVDSIENILDSMMEDEFCYSSASIVREEYSTLIIYKLDVPDYIKEYFKTNDW